MDADNNSLREDSLNESSKNIEKEEEKTYGDEKEEDRKDKDENEERQNVQEVGVVEESKDDRLAEGGQSRKDQTPPSTILIYTEPDLEEESRLEDKERSAERYRTSTPTLSQEQYVESSFPSDERHTAMESELLIADSPITLDLSAQSSQMTSLSLEEGPKICLEEGPKICRVIVKPKEPVVSPPEQPEESDEEQFFSTGNDSMEVGIRVEEDEDTLVKDEDATFSSDVGMEPSPKLEIGDLANRKQKEANIRKQAKKKEAKKEGVKKRPEEEAEQKKRREASAEHARNSHTFESVTQPGVIKFTDRKNLSDARNMSDSSELLCNLTGERPASGELGTSVDVRPTPTNTIAPTIPLTARILTPLNDNDDDEHDSDDHAGGNNENLEDEDVDNEGCLGEIAIVPAKQLLKTSDRPKLPKDLLPEVKTTTIKPPRQPTLRMPFASFGTYSKTPKTRTTTINYKYSGKRPFFQSQLNLETYSKQPIGYYLDDDEDEVHCDELSNLSVERRYSVQNPEINRKIPEFDKMHRKQLGGYID